MLKKRSSGPAPSVRAASSRPGSTFSSDRRMARTISGKVMTAVASAAPAVVKASSDAEGAPQPAADRAARAKQQQQHIAGQHRRQHQRQMHEGIEQRAPGKARARQHPGDQDWPGADSKRRCARPLQGSGAARRARRRSADRFMDGADSLTCRLDAGTGHAPGPRVPGPRQPCQATRARAERQGRAAGGQRARWPASPFCFAATRG